MFITAFKDIWNKDNGNSPIMSGSTKGVRRQPNYQKPHLEDNHHHQHAEEYTKTVMVT